MGGGTANDVTDAVAPAVPAIVAIGVCLQEVCVDGGLGGLVPEALLLVQQPATVLGLETFPSRCPPTAKGKGHIKLFDGTWTHLAVVALSEGHFSRRRSAALSA